MRPLRIELHFAEPIGTGGFQPLADGLLAWCATEEALAWAEPDDPRSIRELANDLPLERAPVDGGFVWKASAWMPVGRVGAQERIDLGAPSGPTQMRMLTRKSDVCEIARLTGDGVIVARGFDRERPAPYALALDTARGLLKNTLITYPLKSVAAIEAWCIGEQDVIETLLSSHVDFFGAKRRLGHGRVRQIVVTPDERASRLWRLRPLPEELVACEPEAPACIERARVMMPLRSPYWDRASFSSQWAPVGMFWQ